MPVVPAKALVHGPDGVANGFSCSAFPLLESMHCILPWACLVKVRTLSLHALALSAVHQQAYPVCLGMWQWPALGRRTGGVVLMLVAGDLCLA